MSGVDFDRVERILERAFRDGRNSLFEHECYDLLAATGAEAAPASRLIPVGTHPSARDLDAIPGDRVVLKIVSPDITHKTEARGVRIVANEIGAVEAAHELMLRQVPEVYGAWLERHEGEISAALSGLTGRDLQDRLRERLVGVLLCRFMEHDARGFATELFVGLRHTDEFGPILSAGFGGVEMEILARETQPGAAVAIAPTGLVDGASFLELFRRTLSYQRLSGEMRGARRLVDDAILEECFQAFIDLANRFSEVTPDARFHLDELEVNPFAIVGAHIAPLDGVCSFRLARAGRPPRPIHKIGHLLRPRTAAVVGVSAKGHNMGRIILNNMVDAGFNADRVRVVRPGTDRIDGVACVPSIADLEEKVDLLVVAVGADQVPAVLDEVLDHDRANAVILIPGGLGEKEGSEELAAQLEERIAAAHGRADGGPVFIGGNSLGVISHPGRYDTMFIPQTKLPKSRGERRRPTAFLSQSGAFIIANLSRMPWLDPAYALSIGNQIDLTAADLLTYLKDDPDIEVVAVYMEGFRVGDGLAFARAVKATVDLGKNVVFYKAGRTTEGRSATAGHTASVAGDYAVCEAAITEAGGFVAADFGEFGDLLNLCVHLRGRTAPGDRVVALSNAGFEAVGMADSLQSGRSRLRLARLGDTTRGELAQLLDENGLDGLVDVKNPLDITPMATDSAFVDLVERVLADPAVDAVVAGLVPLTPALQTLPPGTGHDEDVTTEDGVARRLAALAAGTSKPIVTVVDSGDLFDPLASVLQTGGLPVFRSADRAMRALARWIATTGRQRAR
jgi:acyl-CoA synthetase (NDP forming)